MKYKKSLINIGIISTYEKGKGWKQYKRWENFIEKRVYPDGEIRPEILYEEY